MFNRFLLFLFLCLPAWATTWPSDGSYASVQGIINAGTTVDGDVVTIPDTSASPPTWSSTLTISKAIILQGAGIGLTVIRDGVSGGRLMSINLVSNQVTRITGIEFNDNGGLASYNRIEIFGTDSDGRRIRIDNCKFNQLSGAVLLVENALGVIDHCDFQAHAGQSVIIAHTKFANWGAAQGGNDFGDASTAAADFFGTDKFIFIETCTGFAPDRRAGMDGQAASRYVFRYNDTTNLSVETHGSEAERERSGRAFEVYNNYIRSDSSAHQSPIYFRGGIWVIHDNFLPGWNAASGFNMLDNRTLTTLFAPFGGADGRNVWDTNDGANPITTGTASSVGTNSVSVAGAPWTPDGFHNLEVRHTSGKSISSITRLGGTVTVTATAHGFTTGNWVSVWGANEYPYNGVWVITVLNANSFTYPIDFSPTSPATGTILCHLGDSFTAIDGNTNNTLSLHPSPFSVFGGDMVFTVGDTFEINRVTQSMDQVGVTGGTSLAGVAAPTLPGGWPNQTISPCYEWTNSLNGGTNNIHFTNGRQGGNYATIVSGTHYNDNTTKPGYTPYVYPHPLVSGSVDTPYFSPTPGTYGSAQSVQILTSTSGDTIHYTLDGSTPTSGSAVYSTALTVSSTTTINAIGIKSGLTDSLIGTGVFTIGAVGNTMTVLGTTQVTGTLTLP